MKLFRKRTKNKGLSLVEVLLAVVLLGLVATPILQMFYSSYAMSLKSKKTLAATDLSQSIMEYMSSMSYDTYQSTTEASAVKNGLYVTYITDADGNPVNMAAFQSTDPASAVRILPSSGSTVSRNLKVHESAPTPTRSGDDTNGYEFDFKGVYYDGYYYNVKMTITPPAEKKGDYFTYHVEAVIRGSDYNPRTNSGSFADKEYFNTVSTEVVNKY